MHEILLVEDAKFFRSVLKSQIESKLGFRVTTAKTFAEAVGILTQTNQRFDLALLDLTLPDAPDGEIVDMVSGMDIPSIIFSGSFIEEIRDQLEKPNVIDYVVKDSPASLNYVINTVSRYFKNKFCKVLVVDDSKTTARHMCHLLHQYNFETITAHNGQDALKLFKENDDISLVLLDYHMPDMKGTEVTKRIRAKKSRDEVCIIGISAYGSHALSARFLKAGANDFLVKPFLAEEFFCRVSLNMDALDKVKELDELVHTDMVTNIKNRRYLEERLIDLCDRAQHLGRTPVCAIFELDDFRKFNDEFGAEAGDTFLNNVVKQLKKRLDSNSIIVRYGGSQFCILATPQEIEGYIQVLRDTHEFLSTQGFKHDNKILKTGVTTGVVVGQDGQFSDIINQAQEAITTARQKKIGRFYKAESVL